MTREEISKCIDILLKDPQVVEMIREINALGEEIRELKKKCNHLLTTQMTGVKQKIEQ